MLKQFDASPFCPLEREVIAYSGVVERHHNGKSHEGCTYLAVYYLKLCIVCDLFVLDFGFHFVVRQLLFYHFVNFSFVGTHAVSFTSPYFHSIPGMLFVFLFLCQSVLVRKINQV